MAAIADRLTGGYDPDCPVAILLDTFSEMRAGTVAFLENLPPADRALVPRCMRRQGLLRCRDQVEALLGHDEVKVKRLTELLATISAKGLTCVQ